MKISLDTSLMLLNLNQFSFLSRLCWVKSLPILCYCWNENTSSGQLNFLVKIDCQWIISTQEDLLNIEEMGFTDWILVAFFSFYLVYNQLRESRPPSLFNHNTFHFKLESCQVLSVCYHEQCVKYVQSACK